MKEEKWPWKEDKEEWRALLKSTLKVVGFNAFVTFPVFLCIAGVVTRFKVRQSFAVDELPDMWTMAGQSVIIMYGDCIGFSLCHRLLHVPFFYKRIHKLHHQYTHTLSISSTYAHPIEFALGNMLPAGIPTLILGGRLHIFTFFCHTLLRVTSNSNGHSGYEFPWQLWDCLSFRTSVGYHDFHHSGGDHGGNFSGPTTVLDTLWGTNKKYFRHYIKEMEEKHGAKKTLKEQ